MADPVAVGESEIEEVLAARGVWKSFGATPVLQGVDFSLRRAERVGLMGPSGSGKSTLLHCLGGIERPDRGDVRVDGMSLGGMEGEALARLRREKISSVFQFFHLLPTLSVFENVEFPLLLLRVGVEERRERVAGLIREVNLEPRAHAFPDELSGGEMQRAAIARALVIRPRVILADEPTGNLDSTNGEAVLALLERLTDQHGTALLLVTHSREATAICHRTVFMKDGRIDGAQAQARDREGRGA